MIYMPTFAEVLEVSRSRGRISENPGAWDGIRGAWTMFQGGGKTLFDVSGYDNHGILTNMDPATDWVVSGNPRLPGHALEFVKASSQYVFMDNTLSVAANGVGTMGVWFRTTVAAATSNAICAEATVSSSNPAFWFNTTTTSGGSLRLFQRGTAVSPLAATFVGTGGVATNGEWHLGVVTLDGTNFRIYFDGELEAGPTAIPAADFSTMDNFAIGAWKRSSPVYGDCKVGQAFRTFRELAPAEIKQLYEQPAAMFTRRRRIYAVAGVAAFGGSSQIIGGGILSC